MSQCPWDSPHSLPLSPQGHSVEVLASHLGFFPTVLFRAGIEHHSVPCWFPLTLGLTVSPFPLVCPATFLESTGVGGSQRLLSPPNLSYKCRPILVPKEARFVHDKLALPRTGLEGFPMSLPGLPCVCRPFPSPGRWSQHSPSNPTFSVSSFSGGGVGGQQGH